MVQNETKYDYPLTLNHTSNTQKLVTNHCNNLITTDAYYLHGVCMKIPGKWPALHERVHSEKNAESVFTQFFKPLPLGSHFAMASLSTSVEPESKTRFA